MNIFDIVTATSKAMADAANNTNQLVAANTSTPIADQLLMQSVDVNTEIKAALIKAPSDPFSSPQTVTPIFSQPGITIDPAVQSIVQATLASSNSKPIDFDIIETVIESGGPDSTFRPVINGVVSDANPVVSMADRDNNTGLVSSGIPDTVGIITQTYNEGRLVNTAGGLETILPNDPRYKLDYIKGRWLPNFDYDGNKKTNYRDVAEWLRSLDFSDKEIVYLLHRVIPFGSMSITESGQVKSAGDRFTPAGVWGYESGFSPEEMTIRSMINGKKLPGINADSTPVQIISAMGKRAIDAVSEGIDPTGATVTTDPKPTWTVGGETYDQYGNKIQSSSTMIIVIAVVAVAIIAYFKFRKK